MESVETQLYHFSTPQSSNSFKRPRRSLQSNLSSVSESSSASPRLSGQGHYNHHLLDHINALKHLDDHQILLLLQAARNGDSMSPVGPDRSSMSTLGSRASSFLSVPSSRVPSMLSDPRSSIASSDSSFTHYSTASSRMSTASSRLSTVSTASSPAPKNFSCTFCDKALKSKPYWKSHEEEFHEQRLTWRCPDCEQIFHAGKRFREHHTKLHGCEHCKQPRESGQPTSRKASPCVKKYEIVMHDKDAWGCGFCSTLLSSWEERCEHIALHFEEKGATKWNFTNVVLGLLKQPEVAHAWNQLLVQRHGEEQNWPALTWESKKCNRLRYKLETKWDTRAFDVEKLVQDAYDLAEIEVKDTTDSLPDSTPELSEPTDSSQSEVVEFKLETPEFGSDHRLQSSHGLQSDSAMMDIDSVDSAHMLPHQPQPDTHWPVSTAMSHNSLSAGSEMNSFGGFEPNMTNLQTDFTQSMNQAFEPQQTWTNDGFVSSSDLLNMQQQAPFMNFDHPKEVIPLPSSQPQFADFTPFNPRQSLPPNFLQSQAPTPSPRKYIPKLVSIPSSTPREPAQDHPPPPPPKDEHQQNRFSRMLMRRRPSNISQHSLASQRDIGWQSEVNWG